MSWQYTFCKGTKWTRYRQTLAQTRRRRRTEHGPTIVIGRQSFARVRSPLAGPCMLPSLGSHPAAGPFGWMLTIVLKSYPRVADAGWRLKSLADSESTSPPAILVSVPVLSEYSQHDKSSPFQSLGSQYNKRTFNRRANRASGRCRAGAASAWRRDAPAYSILDGSVRLWHAAAKNE
jgi:hypothetical protein